MLSNIFEPEIRNPEKKMDKLVLKNLQLQYRTENKKEFTLDDEAAKKISRPYARDMFNPNVEGNLGKGISALGGIDNSIKAQDQKDNDYGDYSFMNSPMKSKPDKVGG